MNTQHTAGPWIIKDGVDSRVYLVDDGKGHAVGEIVYCDARKSADARLIAAAPDLLAALELVYSNAGESPEWIRSKITAAIAKATGGAK